MASNQNRTFHPAFWGIVLILAAVVLILDGVGVGFGLGITPWRILAGVLLAAWLVYEIVKLNFTDVFFPLAFLFIAFKEPIATAFGREDGLISSWVVLLAALLLTIGFKEIFKRKPVVSVNGQEYTVPHDQSGGKIGRQTLYFDAADLSRAVVSKNLGYVEVFINNREAYTGGGTITVTENLGMLDIHIPADWDVVTQASENLGRVNIPPRNISGSRSVTLVITENLGQINVIFD
ncbi:MAG: hypothetical protein IKI50_03225 [Clostridia bacterium]|nr:hypothetical protein [Clostridia bacterium]MBR7092179.1 hypothetical protein [Clostridia bacterium]